MKVDGIKLNSSDLSNPEVLLAVAKSKIPFTLGTGASTMEEINSGLIFCCDNGAENIVLMHGVQNFPTKNKDLNISRVGLLKKVFSKYKIGYADHTEGGDSFGLVIDLVALGNGAEVFEKHITIDRSKKGVDYQAALEPEEFIVYCNNLRKAAEAFGNGELKKLSESDLKYRKFQKKSIVAKINISKGTILKRKHIYFVRNVEPGIPPIDIDAFIGKKIKKDISKYDNIKYSDIDI
jgi:sialic acid synthase SpsE